jgi:hypothetical protein
MPLTEIPKVTFGQILKSPQTYMMIVAVCIMMFFVTQWTGSADDQNENCRADNIELRKELTQARADKDALTTALLVKNGIILQQAQDQKELDSTLRKKVGQKATIIVKEK